MWQVYLYLGEVGSEVADRETDRGTLKVARRSILDLIAAEAVVLRSEWEAYARDPVPDIPRTFLEALYKDVTAKAKSIALSAVFGPHYEQTIDRLEKRAAEMGGSNVRATLDRVLAAKDPDEFSLS